MVPCHVVFDLDKVLVNVVPGWNSMCHELAKLGQRDASDVKRVGSAIWKKGRLYSPEVHLKDLGLNDSPVATQIVGKFYTWLDEGGAVYDDVAGFFERLDQNDSFDVSTSVASFGHPEFQGRKLQSLGVGLARFEHVHFTDGPRQKAMRIRESIEGVRIVFVDDNPGEHEAAAKQAPDIIRVQILRDNSVTRSSAAQHHVENLGGLQTLLIGLSYK